MAKKGGPQPGSGRKRGFHFTSTLEKIEARERVRQMVTANLQPLLEAQIANACGVKYLVARDPRTGNFRRVNADALETHPDAIEVWEKDPNVSAAVALLAYAVDRPKEQPMAVEVSGNVDVVHILRSRAQRRLEAEGHAKDVIDVTPERKDEP